MILYEGNEEQVKQQLTCKHDWQKPYNKNFCQYTSCSKCKCVNIFNSTLPKKLIGKEADYPDCANCTKVKEALKKAYYDELTKLPNRLLFKDRLERAIVESQRYNRSFALMFIDLDKFKQINDELGHNVGDNFLKEMANRLSESLRDSDSVARNTTLSRMGGDEFTVIISGLRGTYDASTVAERIRLELNKSFWLDNKEVKTSASMGIALYPSHSSEAKNLIIKADQAMYHVKKNGGNGYLFYSKFMKYPTTKNNNT